MAQIGVGRGVPGGGPDAPASIRLGAARLRSPRSRASATGNRHVFRGICTRKNGVTAPCPRRCSARARRVAAHRPGGSLGRRWCCMRTRAAPRWALCLCPRPRPARPQKDRAYPRRRWSAEGERGGRRGRPRAPNGGIYGVEGGAPGAASPTALRVAELLALRHVAPATKQKNMCGLQGTGYARAKERSHGAVPAPAPCARASGGRP